ncbi:MAG: hypothetical protein PHV49_06480 [Alistipes sp.]|nr:hypothetical protein [Alistipes sp.]
MEFDIPRLNGRLNGQNWDGKAEKDDTPLVASIDEKYAYAEASLAVSGDQSDSSSAFLLLKGLESKENVLPLHR